MWKRLCGNENKVLVHTEPRRSANASDAKASELREEHERRIFAEVGNSEVVALQVRCGQGCGAEVHGRRKTIGGRRHDPARHPRTEARALRSDRRSGRRDGHERLVWRGHDEGRGQGVRYGLRRQMTEPLASFQRPLISFGGSEDGSDRENPADYACRSSATRAWPKAHGMAQVSPQW